MQGDLLCIGSEKKPLVSSNTLGHVIRSQPHSAITLRQSKQKQMGTRLGARNMAAAT